MELFRNQASVGSDLPGTFFQDTEAFDLVIHGGIATRLTYVAVPEPELWQISVLAAGMMAAWRRRN